LINLTMSWPSINLSSSWLYLILQPFVSWTDETVSIVIRLKAGGTGFDSRRSTMLFYSLRFADWLWGALRLLSNRCWRTFPGGKPAGAWSDRTLLSSTEVENKWRYCPYMPSLRWQGQLYLLVRWNWDVLLMLWMMCVTSLRTSALL
jgi:hypothetical protein